MLRILLLSDYKLSRQALAGLLRDTESSHGAIHVDEQDVGAGASVRLEATRPNVVLLHVTRPVGKIISLLHLIRERADVPVVALVDATDEETDEEMTVAAMEAGAAGCVDSAADARELAQALEEAANGQIAVSANCARRLARTFAHTRTGNGTKSSHPDALTTREREVLALLAHGLTNIEIARDLFIAESTVRAHLRAVTQKLGAHNRVHAVARALMLGVLPAQTDLKGNSPAATSPLAAVPVGGGTALP